MDYLKLNEKHISRIVLGCWRLGNLSTDEMETLILSCLDLGINMFDHAITYMDGNSEKVFGNVLKRHPKLRKNMIIQSKCGIIKDDILYYDFSKTNIINSVKESIHRLNCEYLDYLLLHRPDTLMEPNEVGEAFNYLYNEGLVRSFGVSNMVPMQVEVIKKHINHKIQINQLQFNPVNSRIIDSTTFMNTNYCQAINRDGYVLEYCRLHNILIQAWSVLQIDRLNGCLIDHKDYKELNLILEYYADKYRTNKAAVIIAWILFHPINMQAIIGTSKVHHIKEACEYSNVHLTKIEWYKIYEAGMKQKLL